MIVFSDLHLRKETRDIVFNEVLPGIKAAALADAQAKNGVPSVAFLGDWYHLRYAVDIEIQNQVYDTIRDWFAHDIRMIMLVGNHDQVDVHGRNALEVFDSPNVRVVTQPMWSPAGLWIPYRLNPDDLRRAIALPKPDPKWANVAYMHTGFNGAVRNNGSLNTTGLGLTDVAGFEVVLTGHYHKPQQIGSNIFYIGSPYETRTDEGGFPHGYVEFNATTKEMAYKPMSWGPKHYNFVIENPDTKIDMTGITARDHVFVDVKDPKVDLAQVSKRMQLSGVVPVVRPDYPDESVLRLGVHNTMRDYAFAYADQFGADLDIKRLKLVFDEVIAK